MQWRVIVRVSLTSDAGSLLRNNVIKPLLESCHIFRTKTGTWESAAAEPGCAASTLSCLLEEAAKLADTAGDGSPILNHLWIYIDRVTEAEVEAAEVVV
jgi:hypothetical protein